MKFGGTSLADVNLIKSAASKIKQEYNKGKSVIAIVSAMSGTTNKLIKLVGEITKTFDVSEYDTVISSGEQITSGLLSIALKNIGINAKSWLGRCQF